LAPAQASASGGTRNQAGPRARPRTTSAASATSRPSSGIAYVWDGLPNDSDEPPYGETGAPSTSGSPPNATAPAKGPAHHRPLSSRVSAASTTTAMAPTGTSQSRSSTVVAGMPVLMLPMAMSASER
jgi:hypothetical protein